MVCMTLSLLCLLEIITRAACLGIRLSFLQFTLASWLQFWQAQWNLGNSCLSVSEVLLPPNLITLTRELVLCHDPTILGPRVLYRCWSLGSVGSSGSEGLLHSLRAHDSLDFATAGYFCLILRASPVTPFSTSRVYVLSKMFSRLSGDTVPVAGCIQWSVGSDFLIIHLSLKTPGSDRSPQTGPFRAVPWGDRVLSG